MRRFFYNHVHHYTEYDIGDSVIVDRKNETILSKTGHGKTAWYRLTNKRMYSQEYLVPTDETRKNCKEPNHHFRENV